MDWKPIKSAPQDEVFLACMDNILALCVIYEDEKEKTVGPFWKRKTEKTKGRYIGLATPWGGEYSILNLRPDCGFKPTHWASLRGLNRPSLESPTTPLHRKG